MQPAEPAEETSDEELFAAFARAGDEGAMSALVARHGAVLLAFLAGWCEEREDALDLAQETWLRAMRSPRAFRGGSFRAWLLRIARNLAIDRLRRRRPELSLDAPAGPEDDAPPFAESVPDASSPPPDEVLAGQEEKAALLAAVRTLPAEQRDVLLLRIADIPFSEIAGRFGIPLNTALGRMHYAMKRLRAALCPERRN